MVFYQAVDITGRTYGEAINLEFLFLVGERSRTMHQGAAVETDCGAPSFQARNYSGSLLVVDLT